MCEGGGGEKENLGAGEMAQQLESGCSSKHSGFNSSTHIFAHNNKLQPQGLRGDWANT